MLQKGQTHEKNDLNTELVIYTFDPLAVVNICIGIRTRQRPGYRVIGVRINTEIEGGQRSLKAPCRGDDAGAAQRITQGDNGGGGDEVVIAARVAVTLTNDLCAQTM